MRSVKESGCANRARWVLVLVHPSSSEDVCLVCPCLGYSRIACCHLAFFILKTELVEPTLWDCCKIKRGNWEVLREQGLDFGKYSVILSYFSPHLSDVQHWLLIWKVTSIWCREKGGIHSMATIHSFALRLHLSIDKLFRWVLDQVWHLKIQKSPKVFISRANSKCRINISNYKQLL